MKKVLLGLLVVLGSVNIASASTYICYRYVNDNPTGGFIKVQADSKSEAEKKSFKKYKKLGYSLDYTECK
jgi:uncharacterized membrane protein